MPPDLKDASVQVTTLENCEQIAPGQVSASFKKLNPTELTLVVSPVITTEGSSVILQGQVSPTVADEEVTIYESCNGLAWTVLSTVKTQANGRFEFTWQPKSTGLLDAVDFRASWTGNEEYAGTTSVTKNATVMSWLFMAVIAASVAVTVLAIILAAKPRKKTANSAESQTITAPQTPTS